MSFKAFAVAFVLAPVLAVAAPAKKSSSQDRADDTLMSSRSGSGSELPEAIRGHLSVGGVLDFADSFEVSGGSKADSEKAFNVLAQYEFDQFSPGVAAQVGGTYDFSREVKNSGGLKVQEWTVYGELVGKLTSQVKFFGGVNYNFPNMTNAADGASIKGKLGFQGGGSYQINEHFAADLRYRLIEMEISGGGGGSQTAKLSGFVIGGRYIF